MGDSGVNVCPFLIIVIGSPIFPTSLQGLSKLLGSVEPNLIELPNLPSNKVSPSYVFNGLIVSKKSKYLPKSILPSLDIVGSAFSFTSCFQLTGGK